MLHAARADEPNTDTDVLFHLCEECGDNDIFCAVYRYDPTYIGGWYVMCVS